MRHGTELFSNDCYYQFSRPTVITVLAKVDALPSSHIQTPVGDGNGQAHTTQSRFRMSGHVISTLQCMLIFGSILWNKPIENGFHINTNIGGSILIDAQSATRMLAEYIDNACLRQLGQLTHYLSSHQMKPARLSF